MFKKNAAVGNQKYESSAAKEIKKQLKGRLLYLGVLVCTSNSVLEGRAIAVCSFNSTQTLQRKRRSERGPYAITGLDLTG